MTSPAHEFQHLLSPLSLAMATTQGDAEPYEYAKHAHVLSNELVELHRREGEHNLMVFMPPRHGKSEMCSHWFPAWNLALEPSDKIIVCSYEAEVAARWGRAVRRTVRENFSYIGAQLLEDSKAANRWETTHKGGMVTAGVGGPITGKGGNVLILDDPIKNAEEANSQIMRDNLWDWWQTTFLTRAQKGKGGSAPIIVFIMTRWHEDDLAGRILNSSDASDWRVIDFPALARDDDPMGRQVGQALWPQRYDELELESKKRKMGTRNFEALYQQRPTPPEGSAIHRLWWRWYDEALELDKFDQIVQSWDPAFDDAETSDYVVGQVWGRMGGDFYLLDTVRQRMNMPDTMRAIKQVSEQYPQAKYKLIEKSASGFAIIQTLQREMGGILPTGTKSRSKETRLTYGVNNVAAVIERGQVFLPRGRAHSSVLVDEAAQFPHGTHDDMVDAMVMAVEYLMPKAWVWDADQKRQASMQPPKNNVELLNSQLRAAIQKRIKQQAAGSDESRHSPWGGGL